ncbi:acetyltransferase [Salinarimonas sp. NSM]|uniref:acetyltransferase n=1 Tax=Salinarimonas sp. NSM TaxID=3458003 RepID=UPI0040358B89
MTLHAVYGASGCGRGIMPLLREQIGFTRGGERAGHVLEPVFVDDGANGYRVNGHDVLSFEAFLAHPAPAKAACIGIANSQVRMRLVERCVAHGVEIVTVSARDVVIMDDVEIGAGAVLSPFVTLTSNIRIGRAFHANIGSYVEHDCVIGDWVTFAPGVKCNGNVVVEDHAYIGSGAVLRQGEPGAPLVVGRGAVVGMGAVVTRSVPAGVTVVGNPARPLVKET